MEGENTHRSRGSLGTLLHLILRSSAQTAGQPRHAYGHRESIGISLTAQRYTPGPLLRLVLGAIEESAATRVAFARQQQGSLSSPTLSLRLGC